MVSILYRICRYNYIIYTMGNGIGGKLGYYCKWVRFYCEVNQRKHGLQVYRHIYSRCGGLVVVVVGGGGGGGWWWWE